MKIKYKQLISILTIFILTLAVGCTEKEESTSRYIYSEATAIIENSNISEVSIEAEDVIKNSFKYKNEHALEKLLECYTYKHQNSDFRLDNLKSTDIVDLKVVTDESQYRQYISGILSNESYLEVEAMKVYEVKYNIEYNDETVEVNNSGEDTKQYFLIKLQGSDNYLINDVGTM